MHYKQADSTFAAGVHTILEVLEDAGLGAGISALAGLSLDPDWLDGVSLASRDTGGFVGLNNAWKGRTRRWILGAGRLGQASVSDGSGRVLRTFRLPPAGCAHALAGLLRNEALAALETYQLLAEPTVDDFDTCCALTRQGS